MIYRDLKDKKEILHKFEEVLKKTNNQKEILQDYYRFKKGYEQEKDSAYILDFRYKGTKNSILIHDVRLEVDGKTAQFDHIVVSRLGIYIFESKFFSNRVEIDRYGNWYAYSKSGKKYGITSPTEQNARHKELLKSFLKQYDLIPKRFGIKINIEIKDFVLISSNTVLEGEIPKNVIKYDKGINIIDEFLDEEADKFLGLNSAKMLANVMSRDEIKNIAKTIVKHNKPIEIDPEKQYLKYLYDKRLYKYIEKTGCDLNKYEIILISYKQPQTPVEIKNLLNIDDETFKSKSLYKILNTILDYKSKEKKAYA